MCLGAKAAGNVLVSCEHSVWSAVKPGRTEKTAATRRLLNTEKLACGQLLMFLHLREAVVDRGGEIETGYMNYIITTIRHGQSRARTIMLCEHAAQLWRSVQKQKLSCFWHISRGTLLVSQVALAP